MQIADADADADAKTDLSAPGRQLITYQFALKQ